MAKTKKITKAVKYRPRLSASLLNIGAGFSSGGRVKSSQRRVKEGPGRPRGDFKHRDPQTGQPIPATVYYKRVKELRRQQQQQAQQISQQVDAQQLQQLAKRGIPPEQAKQIIDQRQLQSVGVQPQMSEFQRQQLILQQLRQQQMQTPSQQAFNRPSQAVIPIWRRQNVIRYERDIFGNVKAVEGGNNPKNFWN